MTEMTLINEDIIRSVSKKIITTSSSENMPFENFSLSVTNNGYGFSVTESKKNRFSVRHNNEKISVFIRNEISDYKMTFLISDTTYDKLTTESVTESYKKYCINTIYTLYKSWQSCPADKKPDLGTYFLYKY